MNKKKNISFWHRIHPILGINWFWFKWLLLIIPIFLIIRLNRRLDDNEKKYITYYPRACGHYIGSTSSKQRSYGQYRYVVNNKAYEMEDGPVVYENLGNCYSIAYDSTNPEFAEVDWSEQRIVPSPDNIALFVSRAIVKDTVPNNMGWRGIEYYYVLNRKEYRGFRFLKEKFYKKVNMDSLQCCVNRNTPQNSYLYWPGEEPHFCEH